MSTQVLIAIIIGSASLLVAIVAGIAAVRSKTGDSSPGIILLKRILESLWKVLYIIWYPIQAIIEFFTELFTVFIYGCMMRLKLKNIGRTKHNV